MEIYYADGNKKVGPIGKAELQTLIKAKKVSAKTLVWQPGMDNWKELGVFIRNRSANKDQTKTPSTAVKRSVCSECAKTLSQDEMIRFQDSWICAACKPLFVQKIKEGLSVAGALAYAGFWIRFAAILIDGLIMWILNLLIFIPLGILMPVSAENPLAFVSFMPVMLLLQYGIPAVYDTWFIGKYGATPGKMACKLKIVVADGSRVSYLRSLGRHFAKWLSSMILFIGFIMAAFDEEKRTLHDRICETRVIRK